MIEKLKVALNVTGRWLQHYKLFSLSLFLSLTVSFFLFLSYCVFLSFSLTVSFFHSYCVFLSFSLFVFLSLCNDLSLSVSSSVYVRAFA